MHLKFCFFQDLQSVSSSNIFHVAVCLDPVPSVCSKAASVRLKPALQMNIKQAQDSVVWIWFQGTLSLVLNCFRLFIILFTCRCTLLEASKCYPKHGPQLPRDYASKLVHVCKWSVRQRLPKPEPADKGSRLEAVCMLSRGREEWRSGGSPSVTPRNQ